MAVASVIVTWLKSFPGLRSASASSGGDVRERQGLILLFENVEDKYSNGADAVREWGTRVLLFFGGVAGQCRMMNFQTQGSEFFGSHLHLQRHTHKNDSII